MVRAHPDLETRLLSGAAPPAAWPWAPMRSARACGKEQLFSMPPLPPSLTGSQLPANPGFSGKGAHLTPALSLRPGLSVDTFPWVPVSQAFTSDPGGSFLHLFSKERGMDKCVRSIGGLWLKTRTFPLSSPQYSPSRPLSLLPPSSPLCSSLLLSRRT